MRSDPAIRLAVITDAHIVEPGLQLRPHLDTSASFRLLVETLTAETAPINRIVNLGDAADTALELDRSLAVATRQSYEAFGELMAPLRARHDSVPLTVPGNHDDPTLLFGILGDGWELRRDGCFISRLGDVDLIGVDFRTGPEATGYLRPETEQALRSALAESPERRAVLFCHFPWYSIENETFNRTMCVSNGEKFSAVLRDYNSKVMAVFHGHAHVWWSGSDHGVPFYVSPGSAEIFSGEPDSNAPIPPSPLGYHMVTIWPHRIVVRPRFVALPNLSDMGR